MIGPCEHDQQMPQGPRLSGKRRPSFRFPKMIPAATQRQANDGRPWEASATGLESAGTPAR